METFREIEDWARNIRKSTGKNPKYVEISQKQYQTYVDTYIELQIPYLSLSKILKLREEIKEKGLYVMTSGGQVKLQPVPDSTSFLME